MPTLGEELRARREKRGITLQEISESTRIGTRFLKAIETDQYSILPGGIFTRSFIRAFAKEVGMSEDEAVRLYQGQIEPQSQDSSATVPLNQTGNSIESKERDKASPPRNRNVWQGLVIGAGIAIFSGLIALAVLKTLEKPPAQQATEEGGATTSKSQPAVQTTEKTASAPGSTTASTQQAAQPGDQLVVTLQATSESSEVQYWIDGAPKPTRFVLKDGEVLELPPAASEIKLSLGNRPVLKMKINNRDANFPPDTKKWGASVTINRDNLETFLQ